MTREFTLGAFDEVSRSVRVVASTRDPVKGMGPGGAERLESLETWDLERFRENPIILWNHDPEQPIGKAEDIRETDSGLEMRIVFDPLNRNEKAEQVWQLVKAGTVRGVSVGFDFGQESIEERDGQRVSVFRGNVLNETSVVSVQADPSALTKSAAERGWLNSRGEPDTSHDEEERRKRRSEAGRELAMAGKEKRAQNAERTDTTEVTRFDFGTVGSATRTQVGGIRVKARLARTGILEYRFPDGSVRRELRLPEEVFKADSLATLEDATVTDLNHHRGLLNARNWKDATLGHARGIRRDGQYVAGDLVIHDAKTAADVETRKLSDISCGYRCDLEWTEGEHDGQRFDAIQRNIKYNHVAILPRGMGRAGTDVSIRLDATDAECVSHLEQDETVMKVIKIDGKDFEYGSESHVNYLETRAAEREQAMKADNDKLQARLDASEAARKKAAEEAEEEKKRSEADSDKRFRARVRLLRRAFKFIDEDEEKTDAKLDEFEGKTDREIMVECLRTRKAYEHFDGKDKSDDYVEALFDVECDKSEPQTRADGIHSVVAAAQHAKRSDVRSDGLDDEAKAREENIKAQRERGLKPLPVSN